MMSPSEFKQGMRYLAGAVSIITTRIEGRRAGMTATAVCSLTAEPPMLLICVNKGATSHDPIRRTGRFTVNCLSSSDLAIARRFCVGDMDTRFQVGDWVELPSGGVALKSAVTAFDCRLTQDVEVSTHSIFLGMVEQVIVSPNRTPLVYVNGQYGNVVPHAPTEVSVFQAQSCAGQ
jgi:flavin reductase (DIM6/NTAB) family NADH-FMN oxidoreductase RutF